MKTKQSYERTIRSALLRLSILFNDSAVTKIPVTIVKTSETGIEVAVTDASSIMIAQHVIKTDPLNLEVYLAHEIFHDVVHEDSLTHVFDARLLNVAADYVINQYLLDLYGLDVRKVKYEGLFNKKYKGFGLRKIAEDLVRTNAKIAGHFSNSHKHPIILQVAGKIKKKLKLESDGDIVECILPKEYYEEMQKNYDTFNFENLPNVNPEMVVKNLWTLFYTPFVTWRPEVLDKELTQTQALIVGPTIHNTDTMNDVEFSLFCTKRLLIVFNKADALMRYKIAVLNRRLDTNSYTKHKTIEKYNETFSRKERFTLQDKLNRLARRKIRLEAEIKYLQTLPSLVQLLKQPTGVQVKEQKKSDNLSSTLSKLSASRFSRNAPLLKHLRLVQKIVGDNTKDLKDLYNKIVSFTSDFANELEEEKEEEEGTVEKEFDKVRKEASQSKNNREQGDESGEDEEGEGRGESGEDEDEEGEGRGESGEAESGKGSGASSAKLKMLEELDANPRVFSSILNNALDFGEKLVQKSASTLSNTGLVDKTLIFSDDITKLPSSEIGKLGNTYTQLSFLVDLANGNLLQYSDTYPRRSPLILILDCSGSMSGQYYELAAGFCFCLIRKLQITKRGCALIKFSDRVTDVFVWEENKVSLLTLLKALSKPSFGGTNFNDALNSAFFIHTRQHWSRSQVLLVTDGYDMISPSTIASKPAGCKITAVLVNRKQDLEGVDECINVQRKNLFIELVKVGNKFL